MSFLAPMFSSDSGAGYQAQSGNVLNLYNNNNDAKWLSDTAKNGIGNQAAFLAALQGQNGIQNQSNVFAQQQALANQLQTQAAGGGPNPAQAQLAQNTAANTANQAALMASARGASSNPALMAELAARQGAANQQASVGQAATLQAQQQLAAQQALQNQQAQMAGLSTQQVGQQQGAITGQNQAVQNEQQNVLNSIAAQNNANVGMQSNMNSANAGIAGINAKGQQGIVGGLLGGVGTAFGLAHGGVVSAYASGGLVDGPQSELGKQLMGYQKQDNPGAKNIPGQAQTAMNSSDPLQSGAATFSNGLSSLIGKQFQSAPASTMTAGGGDALGAGAASDLVVASKGGPIPGKASVKGDSYANDTVPAVLSPGEIVIPRHITQGPNAPEKAKQFVAAIMAKNGNMSRRRA